MICRSGAVLLSVALLAACDTQEAGIEVAVTTSASLGEGPLHGLVTFRDGEGGVEVSHLHLAIASIDLVECSSPIASFFEGLLISRAYAHSVSTPLHLGIPHVIDAARTSTTHRSIGTLYPPPGEYCGLDLAFGPADEDAVGLDAQTSASAVGRTMVMQGLDWLEGQPKPLLLETKERIVAHVDFRDEAGLPQQLSLSSGRRDAEVVYRLEPSQWIEGLAGVTDDRRRAELVLRNLVASVRATIVR